MIGLFARVLIGLYELQERFYFCVCWLSVRPNLSHDAGTAICFSVLKDFFGFLGTKIIKSVGCSTDTQQTHRLQWRTFRVGQTRIVRMIT